MHEVEPSKSTGMRCALYILPGLEVKPHCKFSVAVILHNPRDGSVIDDCLASGASPEWQNRQIRDSSGMARRAAFVRSLERYSS